MKLYKAFVVLGCSMAVASIAACTSISKPTPMGDDQYMISLTSHGGFQGDGELLQQTIANANQFCSTQGKTAEVLKTSNSGTQMWTPQNNQVVFKCNKINK